MLEILAVGACPVAFAGILVATFVLDRSLSRAVLAAVLAGTGTLTAVVPAATFFGAGVRSPLASGTAVAFGLATLAGAWIAARLLPPG